MFYEDLLASFSVTDETIDQSKKADFCHTERRLESQDVVVARIRATLATLRQRGRQYGLTGDICLNGQRLTPKVL